jgi:glutaredoxin 3
MSRKRSRHNRRKSKSRSRSRRRQGKSRSRRRHSPARSRRRRSKKRSPSHTRRRAIMSFGPSLSNAKIVIYTDPSCGACKRAKDLLTKNNIKYTEYIRTDYEDKVNKLTNNYRYVPVIFVNDKFIGGYDELSKIV